MPLLLIVLAITTTIFRDDIKGIDSYSFFTQTPTISYELATKDKNNNNLDELNYIPHISSFTGFSVGHKDLELSVTFQNEDEKNANTKESDLFDIQLMGIFDNHLWEVFYQNYQGLYITDSAEVNNNLSKANSFSYGLGLKYFTKDNFVANESMSNFSLKKISNWSFVLGTYLSKSRLFSNQGLIPFEYESNFEQLKGLTAIDTFNTAINAGITGMIYKYGFFANGLITFGTQYQRQEFSGINQGFREVTSTNTDLMLELGYSWNKNTVGALARMKNITTPVRNTTLTETHGQVQLYYKYFY